VVVATKALVLVSKSDVDVNEKIKKMLLDSQIVLPEGKERRIGCEIDDQ